MIERIEINLLPAEYRIHKRRLRLEGAVVYPLLAALILGIVITFWTMSIDSSIHEVENQMDLIKAQIKNNRYVEKEIVLLRKNKQTIEDKIKALELISVNKEKWVRLLEVFSRYLPDYTWIISMQETQGQQPSLSIEGRTYSFPEVANFMEKLKSNEYINGVDLTKIEQIDEKNKIFRFHMNCSINPDAGFDETNSNQ